MAADALPLPGCFAPASVSVRIALIATSFERLTGHPLVAPGAISAEELWSAPMAIVAHGAEEDPQFFFGNRTALGLFGMQAEEFCGMPSRLSAEPLLRQERRLLLDHVTRHGLMTGYSGVRISASGARFRIEQATVWNLVDNHGRHLGQAAAFDHWTALS